MKREDVIVEQLPPGDAAARRILRAYFEDVVGRYHGRPATPDEVEQAMRDEPSDDLALLLVAREDGTPVGCVGLRLVGDGIGEVTRLFVAAAARGEGLGRRLMEDLEQHARALDLRELRLDTRDDLVEARALYHRLGYRDTEPFNAGPYADHWLSKQLAGG